jgi:uncharacterized integral membrane protein
MRYLRALLLGTLALLLISVALANRAVVGLQLLPQDLSALLGIDWSIEMPMFLVIFASIIAGLLIGFVWEWLREHKYRATATRATKALTKLERELAHMQDAHALPKDDVLAILETPKAK